MVFSMYFKTANMVLQDQIIAKPLMIYSLLKFSLLNCFDFNMATLFRDGACDSFHPADPGSVVLGFKIHHCQKQIVRMPDR